MKTLFALLGLTMLYSCEPVYGVYISNNSNDDLLVKTKPSFESMYTPQSPYYDTILSMKTGEANHYSFYRMRPWQTIRVFNDAGIGPYEKRFPFTFLQMKKGEDSLVLEGKAAIISALKQKERTRKYFIISQ